MVRSTHHSGEERDRAKEREIERLCETAHKTEKSSSSWRTVLGAANASLSTPFAIFPLDAGRLKVPKLF